MKNKDLFNEPILSLNDLLSVWSENNQIEFYKVSPLFKNFENLAKSKLGIKPELEVGKIYKGTVEVKNGFKNKSIFIITKIDNDRIFAYGFNYKGKWKNDTYFCDYNEDYVQQAQTEEWVETIKKECEKRGLKENNFKCLLSNKFNNHPTEYYSESLDRLWVKNGLIYEKGIFATPIPILTKKEAEEKLNCIIE